MGGSILELIIVLAASAVITLVGIQNDIATRHRQTLTAEGYNEAAIVNALATFLTEQNGTLLAGKSGGAILTPPTLAQLNLKNSYATGPFWGGSYSIALTVAPVGCTAASGNCHIAYQFYSSTPYTRNGVVSIADVAQIAVAANSQAAQFGYANIATKTLSNGVLSGPSYITGIGGAWSVANPLGSKAGIIMATNNGGSSDTGMLYIRRDGSLTWTGDQNANGVSINNLKNVNATGTVSTVGLTVSSTSSLGTATATSLTAGAVNTTSLNSGTSNLGTANATTLGTTGIARIGGSLTVVGAITSSSTIQPGAVGYPRAACATLGTQATNVDGRGQQLSCENLNDGAGAVWIPVGGPTQAYNFYQVGYGSVVPSPSCFAGGTPQIRLVPQTFQVDTTATVNFTGPGSGPWTILITNGSGSPTSNVNGGAIGTGEVETFCSY